MFQKLTRKAITSISNWAENAIYKVEVLEEIKPALLAAGASEVRAGGEVFQGERLGHFYDVTSRKTKRTVSIGFWFDEASLDWVVWCPFQ